MGETLSMTGGKKHNQLLNEWRVSVWEFRVSKVELNNFFNTRKHRFEEQINQETLKRQKLETFFPHSLRNDLNLRERKTQINTLKTQINTDLKSSLNLIRRSTQV